MKSSLNEALRRQFRPEFLNRIDEVIVFHALTEAELEAIVGLLLADLARRLAGQDLVLELTPAARALIAREGHDPAFGARPLKRTIQRLVENPLARALLQGRFKPGDRIVADADVTSGTIVFTSGEATRGRRGCRASRRAVRLEGVERPRGRGRNGRGTPAIFDVPGHRRAEDAERHARREPAQLMRFEEAAARLRPAARSRCRASCRRAAAAGARRADARLHRRAAADRAAPRGRARRPAGGRARPRGAGVRTARRVVILTERATIRGHAQRRSVVPRRQGRARGSDPRGNGASRGRRGGGPGSCRSGGRAPRPARPAPDPGQPLLDHAGGGDRPPFAPALRGSAAEVARIIWAPLDAFLPGAPVEIVERQVRDWPLRYGGYRIDGLHVWGATARILGQLGALVAELGER